MRPHYQTALLTIGVTVPLLLSAQTQDEFRQDFDAAWRAVTAGYAYFDTKATSWADMPKLYADDLQRVTTRDEFVVLLEHVLDELYDPHASAHQNRIEPARGAPLSRQRHTA